MTDRDALLNAVLADPHADLPRWVYADYIEERGEADRAEFIRVQVELAAGNWSGVEFWRRQMMGEPPAEVESEFTRYDALRRRERELWMSRGWSYLPSDWQPSFSVHIDQTLPHDTGGATIAVVRRGFVEAVSAPLAVLFGGPCEKCHRNRRGAPPVVPGCPDCGGTGRTEGAAADLFAVMPVTSVVLSDREPDGQYWWWPDPPAGPYSANRAYLPPQLFELMTDTPQYGIRFPTRDAAVDALSRAAVNLGRSLARGRWHDAPCPECEGTGIDPREQWRPSAGARLKCITCGGSGTARAAGLPPLPG